MLKSRRLLVFAFAAACLLGAALPSFAQFDTATVVGTVKDNTGGVVPGATVTLTNIDTGVATVRVTEANGSFEFMTVRIGRYKVTAELQGFSTAVADNLQVTVGARQRVDLQLAPGQLTETVQVVGTSMLLETDSSQRGQLITGRQAVELPLNGREYSALALLSPGVRAVGVEHGRHRRREGSFNVNGMRSTFNNFLLDGLDNNAYGTSNQGFSNQTVQPSPDAVAEFKVVTNNTSAEYGRSGGATMNVAYRSGDEPVPRGRVELLPGYRAECDRVLQTFVGRQADARAEPVRARAGRADREEQGVLLRDWESFRQNRTAGEFRDHSRRRPSGRASWRWTSGTRLTGDVYPAGTQIPMTSFAQKVLGGPAEPDAQRSPRTTTTSCRTSRTTQDKWGGKADFQLSNSLSVFARYGYRKVDALDDPPIPAAVRRRGQRVHLRDDEPVRDRASRGRARARPCWRAVSAGRGRRPARTRGASARRRRLTRTASRACRPTRASRGASTRSSSPAIPTWGARRRTRSGSTRRCSTPS